jgi:hypothetical protein
VATDSAQSLHLDFDSAWNATRLPMRTLDFRDWGPKVRYCSNSVALEKLIEQFPRDLPPFLLYGSGDFHFLSGLFLRRAIDRLESGGDVTLVSFDNHPDWDIRPPRWSCGGWINRALDLNSVRQVHVWGCGNFELEFPARLFANRTALRDGRLGVHPWAERYDKWVQSTFECVTRDNWRYSFERFALGLVKRNIYITVDMDCLAESEAVTNWENGLFTAADVAWAIGQLRGRASLIGGDLCGAFSKPRCTGPFRRFACWWDHPRLKRPPLQESHNVNLAALTVIWPALTGSLNSPQGI